MSQRQERDAVTEWDTYIERRVALLRDLATTVTTAVSRRDTDHPAFHGCYDWHSAVHGIYALLVASRLAGEPRFADIALATAGDAEIAAEVAALRDGRLEMEVPYGLAWALILDDEAERGGIGAFRSLGAASRDRLIGHLDALSRAGRATFSTAALDEEYPSATWAAIALLRWGRTAGDENAVRTAERVAADVLAVFRESERRLAALPARGFFSPVHLGLLLAADLDGDDRADAAELIERIGDAGLLEASAMPTVHSAGLNFSRAWGAYAAWRVTRDPVWQERFASLVLGHAAMTERWRDDYDRYAHWVPQFGVFAIAESVDR
jgi:hypothetical protein